MGSSTNTIRTILDATAAQGIPDPRRKPAGYGTILALTLSNTVMADLVTERFNWKWNRKMAAPFYTNAWQQDYPQLGLSNIGWLEDADRVEINNTSMPKPLTPMTVRKQLSRTSQSNGQIREVCWMYNSDMTYGVWPGPGVTYSPLVTTAPTVQNQLMSMIDTNGNLLIVTGFGTTGATAPAAAVKATEGTTVTDGSVTWSVVSPTGMGFRVSALPSAGGPVYQINVAFQMEPVVITDLGQTIDPIPDSFSQHFQRGLDAQCLGASENPGDRARGLDLQREWLGAMVAMRKQGDKEVNAYGLVPATSPVETIYGNYGPWTADRPT
jgi:hypothetical protein